MYTLLEVANCHGGNFDYVMSLLAEFREFEGVGIKFQAFRADDLALPDFAYHHVYERLAFSPEQWEAILTEAKKTKEVWIDVFDRYSLEIFDRNRAIVRGLKMQASVLESEEMVLELSKRDLSDKWLMINIAGFERNEIEPLIARVENAIKAQKLIVQVGYQAYPTSMTESGLGKIAYLHSKLARPIAFADHTEGTSEEALLAPALGVIAGAWLVEKHIKHSTMPSEYDFQSAVDVTRLRKVIENCERFVPNAAAPFVSPAERAYLDTTRLRPILKKNHRAGTAINGADITYRRTKQAAAMAADLRDLVGSVLPPVSGAPVTAPSRSVLRRAVSAGEALCRSDFRTATIATVIACRLKSMRLPRKALANLGSRTALEWCVRSCQTFSGVSHTIVATSTMEEDSELLEPIRKTGAIAFRGEPENVLKRFIGAALEVRADVILRVTADCPFVPREIAARLLDAHFASGADYTCGRVAAIGTNVEVINVATLQRLLDFFPAGTHSEYMTFYFKNNPEHFRTTYVELEPALVRDYRLTLDYPEDLEMLAQVGAHLDKAGAEPSAASVFGFLDVNPAVAAINATVHQPYQTNAALIEELNRATTIGTPRP